MYAWSTVVIDKAQPSPAQPFVCVPLCGISGQDLKHTGGYILDTQWNAVQWWFWSPLLHALPTLSFVVISFCSLASSMPPSIPACGHDSPMLFINVTFLKVFFQSVCVGKLWPSPWSMTHGQLTVDDLLW